MPIPLINTPEFETILPSTQQKIFYRPFLVKEEKVLFMALEGGDQNEIVNAVKNVLRSCIITDEVDVEKLAMFDIEYLFLQLRGKSVGEEIQLRMKHINSQCKHVSDVSVNIDDIKVHFNEEVSNKIMLTDKVGIMLNYPSMKTLEKMTEIRKADLDAIVKLIVEHTECIFDEKDVHDQFTNEEITQFVESLNTKQFNKVIEFFDKAPVLKHKIEWTCSACGENDSLELRGLQSFFM